MTVNPAAFFLSQGFVGNFTAQIALPFNPLKLLILIVWVYACLFIVHHLEFSELVPPHRKGLANLIAVFAGPILLALLIITDTAKKASSSKMSIWEVIVAQSQNTFTKLKDISSGSSNSPITLLATSGVAIDELYGSGSKGRESKVLKTTGNLILNALYDRASDILIDPKDADTYTVRIRVDGVIRMAEELDSETARSVINSIKAVSGMDIAERRRPQDGAFMAATDSGRNSFRVASAGAVNGEKLAIRVLNENANRITLTDVGFSNKQSAALESIIKKPAGMILVCGPTGSGKTTTLYSMLNTIDPYRRNIVTIEDPIETVLDNASQIEVNSKAGITFASSLRSILRQDPDVICVGEIRDEETASIALRSAQTGHLVLATLHCDSNASALVRLLDLGVSPLMIAEGVSTIISQRLLRLLCEHCKVPAQLSKNKIIELHRQNINHTFIHQPQGCDECDNTGYYNRTAICDILVMNDKIKAGIIESERFIASLRAMGTKKGQSNLKKRALKKVVNGVTTFNEVKRVIG